MLSKFRSHLRSNVVAYVAIFLVLAGTAGAATSFLKGHGTRKQVRVVAPATAGGFLATPQRLAKIPGMGKLRLIACFDNSGNNSVREQFVSTTPDTKFVIVDSIGWKLPSGPNADTSMEGSGPVAGIGSGTVRAISSSSTVGTSGRMTWQISKGTGSNAKVATVTSTILNRSPVTQQCDVAADVMLP
jgi:hypothetical protein